MTGDRTTRVGFTPPGRTTSVVELITAMALVLSIAVAATVSIGVARAQNAPAPSQSSVAYR